MRPPPSLSRLALAALLTAAGSSAAWSQVGDGNIPAFQISGPLHYSCGGIGSDESTAMRAEMKHYPLSLLFARKDGGYLANMSVDIQGTTGNPIQFNASGPVCLLKLPAGRYTVKATTQGGTSQTQTVEVTRNGHTLDFRY